jgi:hypothetical protein
VHTNTTQHNCEQQTTSYRHEPHSSTSAASGSEGEKNRTLSEHGYQEGFLNGSAASCASLQNLNSNVLPMCCRFHCCCRWLRQVHLSHLHLRERFRSQLRPLTAERQFNSSRQPSDGNTMFHWSRGHRSNGSRDCCRASLRVAGGELRGSSCSFQSLHSPPRSLLHFFPLIWEISLRVLLLCLSCINPHRGGSTAAGFVLENMHSMVYSALQEKVRT